MRKYNYNALFHSVYKYLKMAAAITLYCSVEEIATLVEDHNLKDVVKILEERYPNAKGFSLSSLKRYCQQHNIRKYNKLPEDVMERHITTGVIEVMFFFKYYLKCMKINNINFK